MQITDLNLRDLRRLEPLIRRKETLLARVAGINTQLEAMGRNGNGAAPEVRATGKQQWRISFPTKKDDVAAMDRIAKKIARPGRATKQPRKGTTLAKVLDILGRTGTPGLSVPELARATRLKPGQVSSAIHMNRRRYPGIQRVGRGRYRYVA